MAMDPTHISRTAASAARGDISRLATLIYFTIFSGIAVYAVISNSQFQNIWDTQFDLSTFPALERFGQVFSAANSFPLQGLFDIFPNGQRLGLLPNLIRPLFGPGEYGIFYVAACALLMAASLCAMSRAIGLRWSETIVAATLFVALVLPINGNPLVDNFYILSITSYYLAAGALAVTALYWSVKARSWLWFLLPTAAISVLMLHLSSTLILYMTMVAPPVFGLGIAALFASRDRGELSAKLASAAVVTVVLAAAGIFHYLYAIGSNSHYLFFFNDLQDNGSFGAPHWREIQFLISLVVPGTPPKSQQILTPLALAGAIYLAVRGKSRKLRAFGWGVLGSVAGMIVAMLVAWYLYYYIGRPYKGPHPLHLFALFWPYYAICLTGLVFAASDGLAAAIARRGAWTTLVRKTSVHGPVVALLALLYLYVPDYPGNPKDRVSPIREIPLITYLREEIGIAEDQPFRGSVTALPSVLHKDDVPWSHGLQNTSFAWAWGFLGNDLGVFGFWRFGIPVLYQISQIITPQYYLLVRELLSDPSKDAYLRQVTYITRPNEKVMALLGLRYLLTDYELDFGTERATLEIPTNMQSQFREARAYASPLRLYELADPNVGNYSPTELIYADSAREMIDRMKDPAFDGRQAVITHDRAISGSFVPATKAVVFVRLGGMAIEATSKRDSILVLPVQFSHCWQVVSGGPVTLFRANLMQLGIRFSGDVKIELRQIFGPFWNSGCRVDDARDGDALKFSAAASPGLRTGPK